MNFEQRVELSEYDNRFDLFKKLCADQRVLHVGCVDPGIAYENSLHSFLAPICTQLDGLDIIDSEWIRSHGRLFLDPADVKDHYDLMVVPEVIEHVGDVRSFLSGLAVIDFEWVVVTAPNALAPPPSLWNSSYYDRKGIFEVVHPDHKCWYSPYTLKNSIESFTNWKVREVFIVTHGAMVGVIATRCSK